MRTGRRSRVKGQSGRLVLLLALTACIERQPMQMEPSIVRPDGIVAYLVATRAAEPNEYIVRAMTRRGVALEDPGSFTAALQWTSASLLFVSDASDGKAVRVVAPSATSVRVAGASDQGIVNGELFALRVRAQSTEQINALRLEISDLNDRSGVSIRSALVVVPTVSWVSPR